MIRQRSIITCVILTFVTCGIYGVYWMYCIATDIYNDQVPATPKASPAMVILLDIVTCGIYGWYCMYSWGKSIQQMYQKRGWNGEDRSVIYLVLCFFQIGFIINTCLIQDDLNRIAALPPSGGPGGFGGQPGNPAYNQPYTPPAGQPYTPPANQPYNPGGSAGNPADSGQQANGYFDAPHNSPYNP